MNNCKPLNIVLTVFLLVFLSTYSFGQASTSQNYILANTVKQSGITTETLINGIPISTQGKMQTVEYLDGLGRPIENIITQGSATQHDIITGTEYDNFGRKVKSYLPYSDVGNTTSAGGYRSGWKSVQSSFYTGGTLINVDTSVAPYSLSAMEQSPLNRVLAQGSPGMTWQPNLSNPYDPTSHVVQFQFLVNKAEDSVRIFNIDSLGNFTTPGYYSAGLLTKKNTLDEQQQSVKEYTDLLGRVILKRVLISGDSLQTYYIYDSLNLLRAVIQPEGTVTLKNNSWVFPTGFQNLWMFLYRYDQRNRMVKKKIPGADSVNMLYDQWDRVVLTQDGNLRAGHFWIFTKYDQLNRTVVTGQITDTRSLSAVQTDVTNSAGRFESVSTAATEGYTLTSTFPSSSSYSLTVFTTTHYDSYANLPSWSSGYSFVNEDGIATQNNFLNGQVLATQVRVLGTINFNRSVSYFDDKYRVIQVTADNAAGGKDRITKILSFDGKVTSDFHNHTSRFYTTPLLTKEVYTYDHVDRLLTLTHQTAAQEVVTLNQSAFNELGQLISKKIHQSPSHPNALQKLDYYYNIRGWLNNINRPVSTETGYEEADLFNEELHYDRNKMISGSSVYFNGNISEVIWKGGYDEYIKGDYFTYDQANRMLSSNYAWKPSGGTSGSFLFTAKYDEQDIAYDHNGNFTTFTRYHGDWQKVNFMFYNQYNGNQVGRVQEFSGSGSPVGFQDKLNPSGNHNDYTYDANGNLTSDYNKSITSITYNFLNLPQVITIPGKGTVTYSYDASGNKLQKTTYDQILNKTTNYYYAGDFIYRNDTLEFISHPEGRLRPVRVDTTLAISIANLKYIYDYYLKDHLGSVRSVLTTEQETDLYAATMETATASKENALFNNVSTTAVAKPSGFDTNGSNAQVSQLNGNVNITANHRVGPSIILKVMAGDTVSISTYGWYTGSVQPPATGVGPIVNDLLPLLTNGILANGGSKGGSVPSATYSPLITAALDSFLQYNQPYNNTRPKAYLNWVVVDEEFKKVSSPNHAGAVQVPLITGSMQAQAMIGPANMVVRRNGYLYVYLSNESNQNVDFDNLVISQKRGPLVEQKDYYAFGLEIPGLSTQAFKPAYYPNRKKFQHQEYNDDLGTDVYEFKYRMDDPQIGRFWQIDPLSDRFVYNSTYAFSENKVTSHVEMEGLETVSIQDFWRSAGITSSTDPVEYVSKIRDELYKPGTWIRADAAVGQMAGGVLLGAMTEFLFPGAVSEFEYQGMKTAISTPEINLSERANEIHEVLSPRTQNSTTTAVASGKTSNGKPTILVASSELNLRPAQLDALKPGETPVSGPGHAETTILNHAKTNNITIDKIAASRGICESCAAAIKESGVTATSPLKPPPKSAMDYIQLPIYEPPK